MNFSFGPFLLVWFAGSTPDFQRNFLVSPTVQERKHSFVRVQIEYGFDCFQLRIGLVGSTVWIGSEYGLVILLDESASESQTQNSTRTAP